MPALCFKKGIMIYIENSSTDPIYNLALEEYLVTGFSEDVFRLWQNSPSVIIGRNQNALGEINIDYVTKNKIPVVRRMSGGGAVFHDLGNVNFTFVKKADDDDFSNYEKFCLPIINALKKMGITAELSGRNDILIDGKKISGNAQYKYKDRMLHHGTLLLNASLSDISASLNVSKSKIESKGIKSVAGRVTNINEYLQNKISPKQLIDCVMTEVDATPYSLTEDDQKNVENLVREKYGTYEWNFGYSPKYTYENKEYFPGVGSVEVYIESNDGKITNIRFMGDFFGEKGIEGLEEKMIGLKHEKEALAEFLEKTDCESYISNITKEDLQKLLL